MKINLAIWSWVATFLTVILAAPLPPCNDPRPPPAKKSKSATGPRCDMRFSEFKLGRNADDENTHPFIEVKSRCPKRPGPQPKNPLGAYKMLILRGNPLTLTMLVDFDNFPFDDETEFIVIGSPYVEGVSISLSSPHVQSSFSTTVSQLMLPITSENTYAILLITGVTKTEIKSLNLWITEEGTMHPRVVTAAQAKLMEDKVVDMMVVGPEDDYKLLQFRQFWKSLNSGNTNMFSSEWPDLSLASTESSLSMCDDQYKGFNALSFVLKPESPGRPNKCNDQQSESTQQCPSPSPFAHALLHKVTASQIEEVKLPFDPSWVSSCKDFFPKKDIIIDSPSVQNWLRFKMNPSSCTIVCVACKNYLSSGFRPDVKRKSDIAQDGFLSNNIYTNGDAIKTHENSKLHEEALQFFDKLKGVTSEDEADIVIREFEAREKDTFNATMNAVLFLYAGMQAGISFHAYENLMVALTLMGSNVGWLQHTDNAAQAIAKSISKTLRVNTMNELVEAGVPFSVMADSSTNSNQPFLAVYIQTLKDGYPKTYFYALIHMEQGEKAREMVNSLIAQIRLDSELVPGWEQYFKSAITSISSDGAAVMVGSEHSFKVYLSGYVGRPIPNVVCMAHNLDRAYKVGMTKDNTITDHLDANKSYDSAKLWQLSYFENFEKLINEIYAFYASRGHKKWQHFLRTAEESGLVPKRLKYIYDIRWSESHFRALEAIHHNYYSLVEDLEEMSVNKDFDKTAQAKAVNLFQRMTDKTYLLVLHELMDILSTFKVASKLFQTASSIIVGKAEIVYNVLNSLQHNMQSPGKWLSDFLEHVNCFGGNDEAGISMDQYDLCDHTVIRGMQIEHQYPVVMHYSEVRGIIYTKLIASVKKYFKLELLESFELFNPKKLIFPENGDSEMSETGNTPSLEDMYVSRNADDLHEYQSYKDRALFICKFYHIDADSCKSFITEWTDVLGCITSNPELKHIGGSDATLFWPIALSRCELSWTELAKDVVRSAMVTSYSSSECERGFSIMNGIKTKGRSRMEKETLDSIMRVKINGPKLNEFYSYAYTIEFLKIFVRVDDPQFRNQFVGSLNQSPLDSNVK